MRLLRAELLRSPTRIFVLLLPVLMILHLRTDDAWRVGWPDMAGGIVGALAVASPLVAAVTAYVTAGRVRPEGMKYERAVARSSATIACVPVIGALIHALLGAVVAVLYAVVSVAGAGAPGSPWPSSFGMFVGYLILPVAAGAFVGRLMASERFAPVIALTVMYGFVALAGLPTNTPVWETPSAAMSAVLAAAGVLVFLGAVFTVPLRTGMSWTAMARSGLTAVVAVLAFVSAFAAGGEAMMFPRDLVAAVCTDDGRVCVWPEHVHHRDEIAAGLQRLDQYRNIGLRIDEPVYERGLRSTEGPSFAYPPVWFAYAGMGSAVIEPFWECGESAEITDETVQASQRLMVWATVVAAGGPPPPSVGGGPDAVSMAEIERVRQLPREQEEAWLRTQLEHVGRACG